MLAPAMSVQKNSLGTALALLTAVQQVQYGAVLIVQQARAVNAQKTRPGTALLLARAKKPVPTGANHRETVMVIALVKNAPSVQIKAPGTASMRQAVLTTVLTGAGHIVQAKSALCVTRKTFTTALPKKPARELAASGAFHKQQTTVGVPLPAQPVQMQALGAVILNRNALGQMHSGAQAHLPPQPLPVHPTVPLPAPPVLLKTRGTVATRTHAFQAGAIGAGLTAPKNNAPYVLQARSGTVTRNRPARLSAGIGATLTALQASAQHALVKTREIVIHRSPALPPVPSGAELIVPPTALCALTLPRGIVKPRKIVLAQAATGAATIAQTRCAPSALSKTRGPAVTLSHAVAQVETGANQPGRAEKAGALTTHAQPLHCTLFAETVYARPNLGKAV